MNALPTLASLSHRLACTALLLLATASAQAQVAGAGSTLVRELMADAVLQLGPAAGGARYDATGSSDGVARVSEQSVDFAVSDIPLTAAALKQAGLRQVPLAGLAIAVVVNLPELAGKAIQLNGDILADIYRGNITHWNHSQIAKANPGVVMPARAIVPIWRADGSGSSYVFSTYLARGNANWRRAIGSTSNLELTAGKGVRGGQAMLDAVRATPGAVGYESLGAADKLKLSSARLLNASGKYVSPSVASVLESLNRAP